MLADVLAGVMTGAALSVDLTHPRDPTLAKLFGASQGNMAGVRVDEDTALGLAAFFRGVNIVANGVAKPTAMIKRKTEGGSKDDTRHPHHSLVSSRANEFNSACDLRRVLQLHALLWGNGVAKINRVGERATEIIPLLPDRTGMAIVDGATSKQVSGGKIDRLSGGTIKYVTRVGNQPLLIDPADVIHIRGLSYNGIWGFPVLETLKDAIGAAIAPRDYGARMFGQGALSSGILFMPPGLSEDQQSRFIDAVQAGSSGLGKAHRWMILEEGSDFKPLSLPADQLQMLQTLEHKTKDIANIIGIQSHKLGDASRKSYNSLEQSNQEHLDDDLDPWLQRWEEELGLKLLTAKQRASGTHFIEMDRASLRRTNLEAITSHVSAWRQWGIYSANDARRMQGLNGIGSQGDVYLTPLNMIPADQSASLVPVPAESKPSKELPADKDGNDNEQVDSDSKDESAAAQNNEGWDMTQLREKKRQLAVRLRRQSEQHSRKGGRAYCDWLDRLADKSASPPILQEMLATYFVELDSITRPPHTADDLFVTQAAVASRLESRFLDNEDI